MQYQLPHYTIVLCSMQCRRLSGNNYTEDRLKQQSIGLQFHIVKDYIYF